MELIAWHVGQKKPSKEATSESQGIEKRGTGDRSISNTHFFGTPTKPLDDLALHLQRVRVLGTGLGPHDERPL